jgi:subtilisin family serine protease
LAVARDLLARDEVEYAHPEIVHPLMLNTIHPNQWHLMHTTVNYTDEIKNSANVEAAHRVSTGRGAVIAVIDDGVDIEHPDFTEPGKIVRPGGVARMHDARPKGRSQSHGTAVAGVACAPGKYHACGVAPDAKLMPFRLWFLFSGASPGSIDSADAIYAAANSQADVINCSWGMAGGDWRDRDDPAHQRKLPLPANLKLAIRYAATKGRNGKGCIVVFAAGNNNVNCDRDTFASNEYVLAVAACDDRGRRSRYSCFGKSVFCAFPSSNMRDPNEWEAKPRTAGIWTTTLSPNTLPFPGQAHVPFTPENVERYYTDSFGGTSSAAPGVAGVVALIVSANPALRREQVMDIIRRTCDKIGDPAVEGQLARYDANGHSHAYGYGRVNAERAVLLAQRSRTAWVERGGPIAIAELGEST